MLRQLAATEFDIQPRPVASGSFGVVKLAVHKPSGAVHAIKSMPHMHRGTRRRPSVDSELRHHAAVAGNRHVCTLYGAIEDEHWTHAVLELCMGGSLQQLIALGRGRWLSTHAPSIGRGILHALCECCEQRIVHGDIKPSNVVLVAPGSADVRLIDFGSSAHLGPGQHSATCQFGTPAYAAPEILQSRLSNQLSDVWSVGVLLYQLLCSERCEVPLICLEGAKRLAYPSGTPAAAKDLVACLLRHEPAERLHPYEALGHPFFRRVPASGGLDHLALP